MKDRLNRMLAIGGFCITLAATCGIAGAQVDPNRRQDREDYRIRRAGYTDTQSEIRRLRRRILECKQVYDHEIRSGHTAAALRAHNRASAARERIRELRNEQ